MRGCQQYLATFRQFGALPGAFPQQMIPIPFSEPRIPGSESGIAIIFRDCPETPDGASPT